MTTVDKRLTKAAHITLFWEFINILRKQILFSSQKYLRHYGGAVKVFSRNNALVTLIYSITSFKR